MCNNDVVLAIIKYELVKVGSNLYERGSLSTLRTFAFAMFDWRR